MSKKLLTVSMSPHVSSNQTVKRIMFGVVIALLPSLVVSFLAFGWDAIRVTILAIASAVIFEYIIQKFFLKVRPTIGDGSAIITGLLLAFNVPSNLPAGIIVLGSFVAIVIAKMSFGGLGKNPFNPALVGRVFLLISFPVAMTKWPKPLMSAKDIMDGVTGATPLAIVKEGLKNGEAFSSIIQQLPSYTDMFLGKIGGSLGEVSAIALIIGFLFMLRRKIITWHIPVSMVGSVFIFTTILWTLNPVNNADPMFHVLTGGVLLGAIFMATDMVTSPMTPKGMVIFGFGIGVITVAIRVYGAYPEGVSFAILIMNAFVPLIDKCCKPKRFGEKK